MKYMLYIGVELYNMAEPLYSKCVYYDSLEEAEYYYNQYDGHEYFDDYYDDWNENNLYFVVEIFECDMKDYLEIIKGKSKCLDVKNYHPEFWTLYNLL